jgi:thymidylate kinase
MPVHQPRLIIICGFAGTGKSTVAAKLSETYRLPLFGSDVLGYILKETLEANTQTDTDVLSNINIWGVNYDLLFRLIEQELLRGLTVILDNNMGCSRRWEHIEELKSSVDRLHILPIRLHCPFGELVQRVLVRSQNDMWGRNLDETFLQQVKSKYDFIQQFTYPGLITIDATQEIETVTETILRLVGEWLRQEP